MNKARQARERRRTAAQNAAAAPASLTTNVVSTTPTILNVPLAMDEAVSAPGAVQMTEFGESKIDSPLRRPLRTPEPERQARDVSDYETEDSEKKRMFPLASRGGEFVNDGEARGGGGEAPSTSSGILGKEDSQGDEESEEQRRNEYFEAARFPPATHEAAPMERLPSIDMNALPTSNPFAQQHAMLMNPKYSSPTPSTEDHSSSSPHGSPTPPPRRRRKRKQ